MTGIVLYSAGGSRLQVVNLASYVWNYFFKSYQAFLYESFFFLGVFILIKVVPVLPLCID